MPTLQQHMAAAFGFMWFHAHLRAKHWHVSLPLTPSCQLSIPIGAAGPCIQVMQVVFAGAVLPRTACRAGGVGGADLHCA